jgi:hypothetical protein
MFGRSRLFVGHFAVGLAAKRMAPKVSLATLTLAAVLADVLWVLFFAAGIEEVIIQPGIMVANSLNLIYIRPHPALRAALSKGRGHPAFKPPPLLAVWLLRRAHKSATRSEQPVSRKISRLVRCLSESAFAATLHQTGSASCRARCRKRFRD